MTPREGLAGVLLVDKPEGPTSHDVVVWARRWLDERRLGHAGTLDPFATGLLILCVGSATRLVEYVHLLPKRYQAVLRLGAETTTHDPEGEATSELGDESWRGLGRDEIERACADLTGRIQQVPPAYSAKRVDGRRAHEAARAGEQVELDPVDVTVHELTPVDVSLPEVTLEALVSTGTYVRSLARDLGRSLGCGAHLTALRRTAVGPFRVEDALDADVMRQCERGPGMPSAASGWLDPAAAVGFLPRIELTGDQRRRVAHGQRVTAAPKTPDLSPESEASSLTGADLPVALVYEGELVAVAERTDGQLQPRKVFADG